MPRDDNYTASVEVSGPSHISSEEDYNQVVRDVHPQHHVGRFAITLNIGHDGNSFATVKNLGKRASAYAAQISHIFEAFGIPPVKDTVLLMQSREARHGGPDEGTDILHFDVQERAHRVVAGGRGSIPVAIDQLAKAASQRSIAFKWYDPGARDITTRAEGRGMSGGSDAWGEFDEELFTPYIDHADHVAASFGRF